MYFFNKPPVDYTVGIKELDPGTGTYEIEKFSFHGNVKLEGSFAILEFIEGESVTQIMIVPSDILVAIDWKKNTGKVIKMKTDEDDSDTAA